MCLGIWTASRSATTRYHVKSITCLSSIGRNLPIHRELGLVEALQAWLEKTLAQVPRGSTIAKAIRYALNQWDGLVRFIDDGRIEIDSNTVERAMRPIALTRKNALFAGSDEGAENWAMLASLIETCKLHHGFPPRKAALRSAD